MNIAVKGTKRELPDGWRLVRLGEIIREAQAGFACGKRDADGIAQLRMNNLDTRGNFVWDAVLRVPREGNNIEQFLLMPGDVLFNNTNSTELVGKSALFEDYIEPIVYSNHFTRLRPLSDVLLPDVLATWLNHQWQQGVFAAICNRWIGQSAVKTDKLLNLEILLPPLPEQHRISGILKEQMASVETARTAAQERLEAAKALPAAFLRQVFPQPGQPLPDGWRWDKLKEMGAFEAGGTPAKERSDYWDGEIPFVTGADITEIYITKANARAFLSRNGLNSGKTVICNSGTILIVTRTRVGRVGIAQETMGASQDITAFKCAELIQQEYLCRYLHSISKHLIDNCRGATIQGLTRDFVDNLAIPLPPLPEQQRITEILKEQMSAVEKARDAAEAELETINALPAALLRRAFNGEI